MKEWKFEGRPSIFVRDPNLQPRKATLDDLKNSGVTRNTPRVSVGKVVESPKTVVSNDSIMIELSTNYAFALQQLQESYSFWTIRDTSIQFFNMLPEKFRNQLYEKTQRGVCPLDSEPCLNTYMFALGKMHNAKLHAAYSHLSPEFLQQETVDIVDYGCGQAMGCICYADFLRENGIRQKVRRVVLIEPSELALKRAALHVSLMFPDAELRTVCKGFDDLLPEDLCSDIDTPTLHILSNVLDIGDQFYDLNKFADLVADTIKGYNEFVCVEPLFCIADIDSRPARFFERLQIEPYFRFNAGKGEFVQGQTWTCALLLGKADKREKAQGMAVVRLNDKWGLIDRTGKELFPLRYEWIETFYEEYGIFHDDHARIRLNGKWGFIDKNGEIVIPPKYDWIEDFQEGLAGICVNGKYGFIDKTGQIVIPPKYDGIWPFCDGLAMNLSGPFGFYKGLAGIELNGKWGFIDKSGEIVIPPKYDRIGAFHKGLAGIELNGNCGFINKTGQIVIPLKYDEICDFQEGFSEIRLNGKWGVIDKSGQIVIPPKYDWVSDFHEGLAGIRLKEEYGVIDKTGQIVVPPKYDGMLDFHEGLAGIALNGKWGYIDKTGQIVISPRYDRISDFHEGLARIALNGEWDFADSKWGYIDKTGQIVIPLKYDWICDFHEGFAGFKLDGKWGFIDKTGKEVIPPKYDELGWSFHEGLTEVRLNGKWGIINLKGETVVPAEYDDVRIIRP